jgi:capsular polysaccharide biosynthesis protein
MSEMNLPPRPVYDEYTLSLRQFFLVVWRRLWVLVLVMVLLTGAAVGLSLAQQPRYEASVTILVGQDSGISKNPADAAGLQQLTQTLAQAVNSRPVTEAVAERLRAPDLSAGSISENLTAEQVPDTQFIRVSYQDTDPQRARVVANTIGSEFSTQVERISADASAITATVWERAVTPTEPVSPKPIRNGVLAMVAGLILGLALAFLVEYLDGSWRSPEEAEGLLGVPTFGVIPEFEVRKGGKARK